MMSAAVQETAVGNVVFNPGMSCRIEAAFGVQSHVAEERTEQHAFQACSIDHSDISPFKINNLQSCLKGNISDCDKSSNVPDHLRAFPV